MSRLPLSAERTVRILGKQKRALPPPRVESLEAALDAQMSVARAANESRGAMPRLSNREARGEREQLENYLTRYREAIAAARRECDIADARIVSRAVVPAGSRFFRRKAPTVVLATPRRQPFVATGGVVTFAASGLRRPRRRRPQCAARLWTCSTKGARLRFSRGRATPNYAAPARSTRTGPDGVWPISPPDRCRAGRLQVSAALDRASANPRGCPFPGMPSTRTL